MSAPSLAAATLASTKPRWLRHITATPSPSRDAALGAARGPGALVRRCISPKVSAPQLVDQPDPVGVAQRHGA